MRSKVSRALALVVAVLGCLLPAVAPAQEPTKVAFKPEEIEHPWHDSVKSVVVFPRC